MDYSTFKTLFPAICSRKKWERFCSRITFSETGCWILPAKSRKYAFAMRLGKQLYDGHRISYMATAGSIPPKMFVCHTCDTPTCVNPNHLFIGTAKDNTQDALRKGRMRHIAPRGETHPRARLTNDKVRQIRQQFTEGADYKTLSEEHGVSRCTIGEVVRRKTWRHI